MSRLRVLAAAVVFAAGCGGGNGNAATPGGEGETCIDGPFEGLVGVWIVTEVEGIPSSVGGPTGVGRDNSTWVFRQDGTHEWFFRFDRSPFFFDLQARGAFSLNGSSLRADGMSNAITVSDVFTLTIDRNEISFVDDEGDRWFYCKVE